jgi:cysteine desulfuration protein SufE
MNLAEKQNQIETQLAAFKNGQERLVFLLESAKLRPPLPSELKIEKNLVPGCLARLWLVAETRAGRCFFICDSDSQIVKAVAGLLCDFYSDQLPAEIVMQEPDFLRPLGITQHLTPNRRNALARVREYIRQFAQAAETRESSPRLEDRVTVESIPAATSGL